MNMESFSRRKFIKTTALALPLIASGCGTTPGQTVAVRKSPGDFVRVRNGRFELRGRPHFYVGTNMWYGCYLSDPKLEGGRQRLARELDRLKDIGVTNIRLLAGSETSPLAGAISRGITRSPGNYDEDLLAGLDFCLAEMAKRNMNGILFVSNYWQWSGGFAQYVRWVTNETIPDPDKPVQAKGDWSGFMKFSARLYSTPPANQLYLDYISHLIRRRNTVNGRIYRDDPAIMTWELANEPRPGADAKTADVPLFAKWVDATARFIHEQDPNHLVCTGSEGIHGCLDSPDVFVQSHQSPAIDYVTIHMWLKNWRWLAVPELGTAYEKAADRARPMSNNTPPSPATRCTSRSCWRNSGCRATTRPTNPARRRQRATIILPECSIKSPNRARPAGRSRGRTSGPGAAKAAPAATSPRLAP